MYFALAVTSTTYVLISLGVFGTLTVTEVVGYGETAIAEAARPSLGEAGFLMMAIVTLLATSSSVNATLYASGGLTAMLAEAGQFRHSSAAVRGSDLRRAAHHLGARPRGREPRRPLGDCPRSAARVPHDLPARRRRRLPPSRGDRLQCGGRAGCCWARGRPGRLRDRHAAERAGDLLGDHRDRALSVALDFLWKRARDRGGRGARPEASPTA